MIRLDAIKNVASAKPPDYACEGYEALHRERAKVLSS